MLQRSLFFIRSRMFSSPTRPGAYLLLLWFLLPAGPAHASGIIVTVIAATKVATCGNANGGMTITVSGGPPGAVYQYSIFGGNPFVMLPLQASNIFNNLSGGSYTVLVDDGAGDNGTTTAVVSDIAGPTLVRLDALPASCLNNDASVAVTINGGTAPFTYSVNGTAVGTSPVLTGLASGNETIGVTDGNGCLLSVTTAIPLNNDLSLTMGADATICEGDNTTLLPTTNGTAYSWSPVIGLDDPASEHPVASPSSTITYTLTTTLGICSITASQTVNVLPAPIPDAGAPDTTCYGKPIHLLGSGGTAYQWSPAAGLNSANFASPTVLDPTVSTTYSLTVTDANGCTSLQPATVTLTVLPPLKVYAGNDTSVVIGQSVPLQAVDVDNIGFVNFVWSPATFLSNPDVADPIATPTAEGTYSYVVVASLANGCAGSDTVVVKSFTLADIIVPSAFTPNHDGHNDLLHALCIGIQSFRYFTVFNRFGQQVFTTSNSGAGWDGSLNGTQLPIGTYVWMASGTDYTGRVVERKGTVIVVR